MVKFSEGGKVSKLDYLFVRISGHPSGLTPSAFSQVRA